MDKTLEVQTSEGPVVVKKLAMQDYAELLRALKKLPGELGKLVGDNSDESLRDTAYLTEVLPPIIADAIPEFCAVLSVATDKDTNFHLTQLDLADNIDIFATALQLNDYQRIAAAVKKIMAPSTVPTSQTAAEEPATPTTET